MGALVLRKTYGPFSPGTRLNVIELVDGRALVAMTYTKIEYYTDFNGVRQRNEKTEEIEVDIPTNFITELRDRTNTVPAVPRINRDTRKAKRVLYEMGVING